MMFGTLLTMPGLALKTAAKALRALAAVNEALADRIAGGVEQQVSQDQAPAAPSAEEPTSTSVASQPVSPAGAELDVTALAALPAPRVIAALDRLSTIELADLYELESRRRRRRTVLTAIEAAAAPPVEARDEIDLTDDVRQPDELVHSTSTPTR